VINNSEVKLKRQKSPPEAPACRQAGILLWRKNYKSLPKAPAYPAYWQAGGRQAVGGLALLWRGSYFRGKSQNFNYY